MMRRRRGGLLLTFVVVVLGFIMGAGGVVTVLALVSPYVHDPACDPHPAEKFSANAVCSRGYTFTP